MYHIEAYQIHIHVYKYINDQSIKCAELPDAVICINPEAAHDDEACPYSENPEDILWYGCYQCPQHPVQILHQYQ